MRAAFLIDACASGAPADRLVLELTESVVLDDVAGAADKMNALKALGVGFAVDDFGTGYSSLAYLTRLPLDQIKIDRSFVLNLPGSANDAAVAHTIITLAERLGLAVIAEGVETEAQRRFLERHGCPSFRGFLFDKPMPIDAFEQANPVVLHARLGAELARDEFGIDDEAILSAIRKHTLAAATMSPLDEILYLADGLEPGRDFIGRADILALAFDDLAAAMAAHLTEALAYQRDRKLTPSPQTLAALDRYAPIPLREKRSA